MSIVLPINCGYYRFKSSNFRNFKSRLSLVNNENKQTSNDLLRFENNLYIVGYGKKDINLNKADDFLKILILNMCSKFMIDEYEDFKLLLTSPPLTYNEHQTTLPLLMRGTFEVEYNGIPKIINISDCEVFPETFLVYQSNSPELYQDDILYIIDIGGYSSTIVKITDGNFDVEEDYLTITKGMYNIDTQIRNYLITTTHLPCSLDDIYIYRKNEFLEMNIEMKIIFDIYNELIQDLVDESIIKGWNMRNAKMLITGGGGLDLFKFIKKNFYPQAILSQDPVYDNLHGLESIMGSVFAV